MTEYLTALLVTDTRVYEVIRRTAKTITVRATQDGDRRWRDRLVDGGNSDHVPPVIWTEQVPDENAPTHVVRLRKDGTHRMHRTGNPLRSCPLREGVPVRRTDYRY